jgi:hypothetical protein
VVEDLRQLCIWHSDETAYWKYLPAFYVACHPVNTKGSVTRECADQVFGRLFPGERLKEEVHWCMENKKPASCRASEGAHCGENLIVEQAKHKAWSPHAVQINGWRYSGPLEMNAVARQVCEGFIDMPAACAPFFEEVRQDLPSAASAALSAGAVLLVFALVVAGAMGSVLVYRNVMRKSMARTLREEVMLEVRAQMQDYQMLDDRAPLRTNSIQLGRLNRE